MGGVPIERDIDFNYGFRVMCPSCASSHWHTAEEYLDSLGSEAKTCKGSGKKTLVVAPDHLGLRDQSDPVAGSKELHDYYWYHSTPCPDWPPTAYQWSEETQIGYERTLKGDALENVRRSKEDQALHLGTYEAAVENVLRRMDAEGERDVQFYLHRVQLKEGLKFNDKPRPDAAVEKTTQAAIREKKLSGIRYLNNRESPGSVSLAVVREAIASSQCIKMPPEGLVADLVPGMMEEVLRIRKQEEFEVQAVPVEESPSAALLRALSKKDGKGRTGPSVATPPAEVMKIRNDAWSKIKALFAGEYLENVSPVLREQFFKSVRKPGKAGVDVDDRDWLRLALNMAPFLARHEDIRAALDNQPWVLVSLEATTKG